MNTDTILTDQKIENNNGWGTTTDLSACAATQGVTSARGMVSRSRKMLEAVKQRLKPSIISLSSSLFEKSASQTGPREKK